MVSAISSSSGRAESAGLFPHADGSASYFLPAARALADEIDVLAVDILAGPTAVLSHVSTRSALLPMPWLMSRRTGWIDQ